MRHWDRLKRLINKRQEQSHEMPPTLTMDWTLGHLQIRMPGTIEQSSDIDNDPMWAVLEAHVRQDLEAVITSCQRILAEDEGNISALFYLGLSLYKSTRYQAAEKEFRKLAEHVPQDMHALLYLALCRHHQGDTSGARSEWQKAADILSRFPEYPEGPSLSRRFERSVFETINVPV